MAETAAVARDHIGTIHGKIALLHALATALAALLASDGSRGGGDFPSFDVERAD